MLSVDELRLVVFELLPTVTVPLLVPVPILVFPVPDILALSVPVMLVVPLENS
jgi:hypothetical protein